MEVLIALLVVFTTVINVEAYTCGTDDEIKSNVTLLLQTEQGRYYLMNAEQRRNNTMKCIDGIECMMQEAQSMYRKKDLNCNQKFYEDVIDWVNKRSPLFFTAINNQNISDSTLHGIQVGVICEMIRYRGQCEKEKRNPNQPGKTNIFEDIENFVVRLAEYFLGRQANNTVSEEESKKNYTDNKQIIKTLLNLANTNLTKEKKDFWVAFHNAIDKFLDKAFKNYEACVADLIFQTLKIASYYLMNKDLLLLISVASQRAS